MVKKQETKEGEEAKHAVKHETHEKAEVKAPVKQAAKHNTAKTSDKVQQQAAIDSGECTDKFCPTHGETKLHGRVLAGTVISAKAYKTVTVDKLRSFYLTKYERYEKRHTKLLVHNPPCINAKVGDEVKIMETRPLSKTKHFIVIEVLSKK
jgi:small subunit ribosomal protein S17